MNGVLDPLYVRARAALLDATDALAPHVDALVLVGAQAIYLHAGDTGLGVAEYTTDADFSLAPGDLADSPLLGDLLTAHGFIARKHPPAALLVAKIHTIAERVGNDDRVRDKDALDVLRLLRSVSTDALAGGLATLGQSDEARAIAAEALVHMHHLFAGPSAPAVTMAVRAAGTEEDPATITASLVALAQDLLETLDEADHPERPHVDLS